MAVQQDTGQSLGEKELRELMRSGRLPHGVVLESRAEGKLEEMALYLAKWAVCVAEYDKRPCNVCGNCVKAQSGNHSDIYTAKSSGKTEVISVDEIRHICSDAYIIANEANRKVYILPKADNMQAAAQNAFLKVLEEPPQNILFVLLCTSAEKLLSTIRSRTVVFSLDAGETQIDEQRQEAQQTAERMALAMLSTKGYPLMAETGKLTDRTFSKLTLSCFAQIIRDALVAKSGGNAVENAQAEQLGRKISTIHLIEILSSIQEAQHKLERNVNMTLFSAWLCSTLRRKK